MKTKIGTRIGIVFILALVAGLWAAGEDLAVTVTGEAAGEGPAAKEKAVEDALRNAVEKGFGVFIDAATLSENAAIVSDVITAQTRGFVRSYEVLEDRQEGGIRRVTVRAMVALDKVWESDSLQLLLKRMEAPRFSVHSKEEIAEGGTALKGSPARDKMIGVLAEKGFVLVETPDAAASTPATGDQPQFRVEVEARGIFDHKSDSQGLELYFFSGQAEAKVVQTDTGKIIAAAAGNSMRGARTPEDAGRDALTFASGNAAGELVQGILKTWVEMLNSGRDIDLEVQGISASELSALTDALKALSGVREVSHLGFASGKAQLALKSKRKTMELAADLEGTTALKLKITKITANRIEAVRVR